MIFNDFDIKTFIWCVVSVYCTSDVSNPTPVYAVLGGDDVLQCGFESSSLEWFVYNGGKWNIIASRGDVTDDSKYSTYKNPLTGLYYRLHIKNIVVSDLKQYRCSGPFNGGIPSFYLQLILIGMCNYTLDIFSCW
jgi:hypothetical protein